MISPLWIREMDSSLLELTKASKKQRHVAFPLEECEKHLSRLFAHSDLNLKLENRGWKEIPLMEAENFVLFELHFYPLEEPLYFSCPKDELKFLMSTLLNGEEAAAPFIESDELSGFAHYLGLEVLNFIDRSGYADDLAPRLKEISKMEGVKQATVIDTVCTIKERKIRGTVYMPRSFDEAWKRHFSKLPQPPLTKEEKSKIPVMVAFELGQGRFSFSEWREVKEGDFLVLDQSAYDPETRKGRVLLTLGGKPIFRGKIRDEGIKLLEYPLYEEMREEVEEAFEEEDVVEAEEVEEKKEDHIKPEAIEVTLTVEAGRVKMSVDELLALAPGSVIDLKIAPEQGVDLVISGKKVGRGELVKMGDLLGVRVLKL